MKYLPMWYPHSDWPSIRCNTGEPTHSIKDHSKSFLSAVEITAFDDDFGFRERFECICVGIKAKRIVLFERNFLLVEYWSWNWDREWHTRKILQNIHVYQHYFLVFRISKSHSCCNVCSLRFVALHCTIQLQRYNFFRFHRRQSH